MSPLHPEMHTSIRLPTLSKKSGTILAAIHWMGLIYVYGFFVLKSTLQFSHPADVLAFHLPRALMYAGLTTYEYGTWAIEQSQGYPGLPNLVQGILIKLSGQINAVNTVNILAFGCAVACIWMLYKKTFSFRWFLTFCLSVPLFYYHITIGFIDLFASCMILIAFAGLHGIVSNNKPFASGLFLVAGCTLAMFSKMTVWPAACTLAVFGMIALFYAYKARHIPLVRSMIIAILLVAGIAFYPVSNQIRFQNPTYPLRVRVYMKTLPAVAVVSEVEQVNIPRSLQTKSQSLEFIYSILEMNRGDGTIPFEWAAFQNHGRPFERDQLGGFFVLTVLVLMTVLLLIFATRPIYKLSFSALVACIFVTANLPHSGVLRYSLFLPLMGIFLICTDFTLLKKQVRHMAIGGFTLCLLIVIPNLGSNFWVIDLRPHDSFAPTAARNFWTDNRDTPFAAMLLIEGAYPSTIFWAGPNFNTWKVKEVLENRYINTIRPAQ